MKNLRLKAAHAAKDLSQQRLVDLASVSRRTTNAVEEDYYSPAIRFCLAIYHTLDKTLGELFWEV